MANEMKPSDRDLDKARVIHGIMHDVRLTDKESVKEVAMYLVAERAALMAEVEIVLDGISPARILSCIDKGDIEQIAMSTIRYAKRALIERLKGDR